MQTNTQAAAAFTVFLVVKQDIHQGEPLPQLKKETIGVPLH